MLRPSAGDFSKIFNKACIDYLFLQYILWYGYNLDNFEKKFPLLAMETENMRRPSWILTTFQRLHVITLPIFNGW